MNAMNRLLLFSTVGIATVVNPAVAQVNTSGALLAGYSSIAEDGATAGSFGALANIFLHTVSTFGIGIEIGYHGYGSEPAFFESSDDDGRVDIAFDGDVGSSALQATVQAKLQAPHGTGGPFATFGAGVYVLKSTLSGMAKVEDLATQHRARVAIDESTKQTELGFNIGGGLQYFPQESRARFVLDARMHVIPGAWIDVNAEESALNTITLMAGFAFH